jgi:hypothetical protein
MQVTSNESYHSSNSMCNPFPKRMTQQNNNWESSGSGAWQPLSLTVEMATSFQRCGTLTLNPIKALSMRSLFSFEELYFLTQHWVKPTTPSALNFWSIQGNQLWPRIPSSLPSSIPPPKIDQILLQLKRWWWWWCWEKRKIKTHTNNSLTQLTIIMLSNNFKPLNHWIIIIMRSLEILIDHES